MSSWRKPTVASAGRAAASLGVSSTGPRWSRRPIRVGRPIQGDEAVFDRLDQADREIGLEDPAAPPGRPARPWSGSVGAPLERGRGRGQLVDPERLAGRGEQAQDPPALRRPLGEAGHDQLVERAGQRRAGQLASGGQDLLGDEGVAARPLGDEQEHGRRRTLALDALDELGQLVAIERLEGELGRRRRALGHRRERHAERVAAGQLVGLVGGHDAQPTGPRHAGEERRQRAGARVGRLEVLQREHDRHPLADPDAGARGSTRASGSGAAPGR